MEFELVKTKGRLWATFIYASIKDRTRAEQWQDPLMKSRQWGIDGFWGETSMILGILREKKEGELDLKKRGSLLKDEYGGS